MHTHTLLHWLYLLETSLWYCRPCKGPMVNIHSFSAIKSYLSNPHSLFQRGTTTLVMQKRHYGSEIVWNTLTLWIFRLVWLILCSAGKITEREAHLYPPCHKVYSCVHPNQSLFLSSADDDYSDTYNATYAVINNGEECFMYNRSCVSYNKCFSPNPLVSFCLACSALLLLPWCLLCPVLNRWLQLVIQSHYGPPCSPDTYIQATRQKPLGQ